MTNELADNFRRWAPRLNPKPASVGGAAVFLSAVGLFLLLIGAAFFGRDFTAWGVGIVYLGYDTGLILFVVSQWAFIVKPEPEPEFAGGERPTIGVIIAAYNEAAGLPPTIDALLAQTDRPDEIWVVDDGSTDSSGAMLEARYALKPDAPSADGLHWMRVPHRGKANALNAALERITTDVAITVDADTLLAPDAIGAIRRAFAADPHLAVGGGVLTPVCENTAIGRTLQAYQTYEYIRNFLDRFAWSRFDCLVLVSGAFAAFRREAVVAVGGFDPVSLTEDYELIHRLRRLSVDRGLGWRMRIIPGACATTDAPAQIIPFLRQRRRWFAGFLHTHYSNRDIIAAPRFRAFGLAMMPIKTLDTVQPFYALASSGLLIGFIVTGRWNALLPASGIAIAKIGLDLAFAVASVEVYRRWTGLRHSLGLALACALTEPFAFQLLRRGGSAWGWFAAMTGASAWGHARSARDLPASGERPAAP